MKALLLAAAVTMVATPALAASPVEGNWVNPSRSVTVRIGPCGGGTLCGRVVAATAKAREDAAHGGTTNLIGTELMSDLVPNGEGSWHGSIFVPDVNRRAEAEVHLMDARTLQIEGCALGGLLCKSQVWTRAAAPAKGRRRR